MSISIRQRLVTVMTGVALLVCPARAAQGQDENSRAERRALDRAVGLAGLDAGIRAVLIEPDLAPDPEPLRALDAFVVRERNGALRPIIYVNRRSEIVRQAADGSRLYGLVLAAVLHHEARHLAGASEADARHAELEHFRRLLARHDRPGEPDLRDPARRYLERLARQAGIEAPVSPHR
jgi:hypothetical protein